MSAETLPTPPVGNPAVPTPATPAAPAAAPPQAAKPVPEQWKPLFAELTTYYRHLPELLGNGEAGRFVVVKGDELGPTWDTCRDALQYGYERYGDQPFMVHRVDPRELDWLAPYFPPREAPCPR